MTVQKRREIIITPKAGGATRLEDRCMGLHARDTQTGANVWLPMSIRRNGIEVTGRDAAEHVASLLLLAQGAHGKLGWDRDAGERTVFTVFDA
jgi:hypothetical protein